MIDLGHDCQYIEYTHFPVFTNLWRIVSHFISHIYPALAFYHHNCENMQTFIEMFICLLWRRCYNDFIALIHAHDLIRQVFYSILFFSIL